MIGQSISNHVGCAR